VENRQTSGTITYLLLMGSYPEVIIPDNVFCLPGSFCPATAIAFECTFSKRYHSADFGCIVEQNGCQIPRVMDNDYRASEDHVRATGPGA
jgi:hypothetical protein